MKGTTLSAKVIEDEAILLLAEQHSRHATSAGKFESLGSLVKTIPKSPRNATRDSWHTSAPPFDACLIGPLLAPVIVLFTSYSARSLYPRCLPRVLSKKQTAHACFFATAASSADSAISRRPSRKSDTSIVSSGEAATR